MSRLSGILALVALLLLGLVRPAHAQQSTQPKPIVMDTYFNLSDPAQALNLTNIRFQLIRLEDTITFNLIERVQFPLNAKIYVAGAIPLPNSTLSLFDWILSEQERLQSLVRRYESPDEYPFFPAVLQKPILPPLHYPQILHPNNVNLNNKLKCSYTSDIVPKACANTVPAEAEGVWGSAATADVTLIQALSRRIHFGKFVAEAKFLNETERFVTLIKDKDTKGIDAAITDSKVEQQVLDRLRLKAETYGKDPSTGKDGPVKIDADAVVSVYKNFVIPLTKEVEVDYLLQRLKGTKWE